MWLIEKQNLDGKKAYKYCERYTDTVTGQTKTTSVTLDSKSKATQKVALTLLQEKIKKLIDPSAAPITFSDCAEQWIKHTAPTLKPTTVTGYEGIIKQINLILPDKILLTSVKLSTVQDLLYTIYHERQLSFAYAKMFLIVIRAVFKYSRRMKYIKDISFLDDVELKRRPVTIIEEEERRNKFLDRAELKAVLADLTAIHPRIALCMEFIALTGLRFGELAALRLQDYNEQNKTIYVNGSISHYKNNLDSAQRGTPKNVHSIRHVTLCDRSAEIIKTVILENKKRTAWNKDYIDRGYIFTSEKGNPLNLPFVNRLLRKIQNKRKLSSHIFRHTHISLLAEMNIPLKSVMNRVGHNDPRTTLSIYTHVTDAMHKDLITKLNTIKIAP